MQDILCLVRAKKSAYDKVPSVEANVMGTEDLSTASAGSTSPCALTQVTNLSKSLHVGDIRTSISFRFFPHALYSRPDRCFHSPFACVVTNMIYNLQASYRVPHLNVFKRAALAITGMLSTLMEFVKPVFGHSARGGRPDGWSMWSEWYLTTFVFVVVAAFLIFGVLTRPLRQGSRTRPIVSRQASNAGGMQGYLYLARTRAAGLSAPSLQRGRTHQRYWMKITEDGSLAYYKTRPLTTTKTNNFKHPKTIGPVAKVDRDGSSGRILVTDAEGLQHALWADSDVVARKWCNAIESNLHVRRETEMVR